MLENFDRPQKYDAVLGGKNLLPLTGAVLGGMAGVKHRLQINSPEQRVTTIMEALNYGDAGLEVIIQALDDESQQVRDTACLLLQTRSAKTTLLKKDMTIWNKWRSYIIRLEGSNLDLSKENLSQANLSGFNLIYANLIRANLYEANLSGANLQGANLSDANLVGANLSGAMLSGALLYKTNFSGANFQEANLIGANLQGANLSSANFEGAILHHTIMPDGKICE